MGRSGSYNFKAGAKSPSPMRSSKNADYSPNAGRFGGSDMGSARLGASSPKGARR